MRRFSILGFSMMARKAGSPMHAELDQQKTDLHQEDAPIYLPPAGDNLQAWRDHPYQRDTLIEVLTYWVTELRWRRSFWGKNRG